MSPAISSGALRFLQEALNLDGAGAQRTLLEDGLVQLVLDVSQMASSSTPNMRDKGMILIAAQNVHAVAGELTSSISSPYDVPTGLNLSRADVEPFDIWLHRAFLRTTTTNLDGAAWTMDQSNVSPAITDGVTAVADYALAVFSEFFDIGPVGASNPVELGFRMPRTATGLNFSSESNAAGTVEGVIIAELVPQGMRPGGF